MRMMLVAAALLTLALAAPLGAQITTMPSVQPFASPLPMPSQVLGDRDAQEYPSQWARSVNVCSAVARSAGGTDANFDVTVTAPGQVNIVGSGPERLEFEKCMRDSGQPVK